MTTMSEQPTVEAVLARMTGSLNGTLPMSVQHAATAMPEMVLRHAADSAFAMPPEGGALAPETRTLIYLVVALATGSHVCVEAMINKAQAQGISREQLLETFKIARFAEATRVFGNAEYLLAHVDDAPPA